MRTAVGLELKAVRVIRRGDDQRVLVPVRNGHLADHCLGEECNPGIGEECNPGIRNGHLGREECNPGIVAAYEVWSIAYLTASWYAMASVTVR